MRRMEAPRNLIVDERELERFVSWLPELEPHQAYLTQLMIRSRGLKEKYGFKGTDHVLMFKAVHGYLRAVTPDGIVYWRVRLKHDILRLGLLGAQGDWEYANYEPGGRNKIRHLVRVPWQIIAVYININPADTIRALQLTTKELVDSLAGMAHSRGLEMYTEFFRRPDQRYYANLARSTKTRFHVIDIDDMELSDRVLELFIETFGFRPSVIRTHRGIHVIIDLQRIVSESKERLYVGRDMTDMVIDGVKVSEAERMYYDYYVWPLKTGKTEYIAPKVLEKYKRVLEEYIENPNVPFFHRVKMMGRIYVDNEGKPLVELKKQALEPVPGSIYKGEVVVRFLPGEV